MKGRPRNTEPSRHRAATTALGIIAGLVGLWIASPAAAVVYKWADAQGNIHYSDLPPPPEGKLISVDNSYNPHHSPVVTQPSPPPVQTTRAGPATTDPETLKKTVDSDVATAHQDDCKKAQDRYATYIRSRHLYKEGQNGERVYLSDAELETERLNAKKEVDEVCAKSQ